MKVIVMKEYLLSTNVYLEPAVSKDQLACSILLVRLLLLEPGTNPLHPEMGVGLGPKYRFISENELSLLQERIENQIRQYLPEFGRYVDVTRSFKPNSKYLQISIRSNDTNYIYDTGESDTPIELSKL